jgi:hypothetical protein
MKVTSSKKVTKNEKKFLKKTTCHYSETAWHCIGFFCGQTTLSLQPYDCNAQIICIGCCPIVVGCFKKIKIKRTYV